MTIHGVLQIAELIDPDATSFKANSTRESRNAKWAFIIGCVHHGHSRYNNSPDPNWFLKSAGGGRPQSDDCAVHIPDRNAWDCIPFAGRDDAHFEAGHIGVLPNEQVIITPPVPDDGGVIIPLPTPEPIPLDDDILETLHDIHKSLKDGIELINQNQQILISILQSLESKSVINANKLDQQILHFENLGKQLVDMREYMAKGRFRVGF